MKCQCKPFEFNIEVSKAVSKISKADCCYVHYVTCVNH